MLVLLEGETMNDDEIIQIIQEQAVCCGKKMKDNSIYINGTSNTNFVCLSCGCFIGITQEILDDEILDNYREDYLNHECDIP